MLGNAKNLKESDSALMLSFAAGDLEGFELLYRRHSQSVYRFFYFGTHGDETLAAELYQDVWMTVVRGRVRYTDEISFTDWLYHSAWARLHDHLSLHPLDASLYNSSGQSQAGKSDEGQPRVVSMDEFKKKGQSTTSPDSSTIEEVEQDSPVEKSPAADNTVLSCISEMNPEHKEVMLLHFCFSMSNQEIADFLDVSKSVVDRTCREAIRVMRCDLKTETSER